MTRPLQLDDPLATLLMPASAGPGFPTELRTGRVVSWNTLNGTHTVSVDGTVLTNLSMFKHVDFTSVNAGDTVTLLATRDSNGLVTYGIVGVWRKPPFS